MAKTATRTVLPMPCGQHDRAPDHLVGVLGIDPEPQRQVDRLVELGVGHGFDERPSASSTEYGLLRVDLLRSPSS